MSREMLIHDNILCTDTKQASLISQDPFSLSLSLSLL